jgi:hypothetical protein
MNVQQHFLRILSYNVTEDATNDEELERCRLSVRISKNLKRLPCFTNHEDGQQMSHDFALALALNIEDHRRQDHPIWISLP